MSLDRRNFLKKMAAVQAGAALSTAAARQTRKPADVIVVGAGAFGGWTAYYLRQLGASVRVVDAYGPGNSRATSGDETRGVRSSYGDRGANAELWGTWANRAIDRWTKFDAEWGRQMKVRLFFNTGDLIFRSAPEPFTDRTQEVWKKLGIPFQVLKVDDVRKQYPSFDLTNVNFALYDPRAGVVRARRACEVVAEAFRQSGGEILMGYAAMGDRSGAVLQNIKTTGPTATLTAGTFVFALGPWFPKAFPDLMASRIRTPLGHVHYFGTPPGDSRFTDPQMPVWVDYRERLMYGIPGNANRGFKVADDTAGPAFDPTTGVRDATPAGIDAARAFLARRFPALANAPLLGSEVCQYEASPDSHFIVDRHPAAANVWIAGGGSGHGYKMGPALGEMLASYVLGTATPDPQFALARLAAPPRGGWEEKWS